MSLFDDDLVYDDDSFDTETQSAVDFSSSKMSSFCIGHDQIENQFLDFYNNDNMPHALIFSGTEGIGKTTMAFRLARFLLKSGVKENDQGGLFGGDDLPQDDFSSLDICVDDPVFSRVASGGHGDLLHIERHFDSTKGKRDVSLKVDALRKIAPFLRTTSSEGGWRIVIVEDADTMNRNAQNAILKILEEPPANVLLILVVHRLGALIPTIRSRSRVVPFSTLSSNDMSSLLQMQGAALNTSDKALLSALAEGSFGKALRYLDDGGLEQFSKTISYLDHYPTWHWPDIHTLSSSISSASQDKEYRMFIEILQWSFRTLLFYKAREDSVLPDFLSNTALNKIFHSSSLHGLINVCDGLNNHFSRTDFSNLDRRDAVRTAFLVINESLQI